AATDIAQFVDQVEECEERNQRGEDQQRREQDVATDIALEGFHRRCAARCGAPDRGRIAIKPAPPPDRAARARTGPLPTTGDERARRRPAMRSRAATAGPPTVAGDPARSGSARC